jgi:hypothetical protein
VNPVLHKIDPAEADALHSGTSSLATALASEARKAIADPQYLENNYGHVFAEVKAPINDGSGENLYLRAMLYGVEINKNPNDSAISIDEFKQKQIDPAAQTALERMRFTGLLGGPANLNLSDADNKAFELSAKISDVEVFRMNKKGDTPQSLAESIAADVFPLVIHQPTKDRWLNALHNDAVRLSQSSPQWQSSLKEKIDYFHASGMVPQIDFLPGSVIDIKIPNANGNKTAEIVASPDKPTSYVEF